MSDLFCAYFFLVIHPELWTCPECIVPPEYEMWRILLCGA